MVEAAGSPEGTRSRAVEALHEWGLDMAGARDLVAVLAEQGLLASDGATTGPDPVSDFVVAHHAATHNLGTRVSPLSEAERDEVTELIENVLAQHGCLAAVPTEAIRALVLLTGRSATALPVTAEHVLAAASAPGTVDAEASLGEAYPTSDDVRDAWIRWSIHVEEHNLQRPLTAEERDELGEQFDAWLAGLTRGRAVTHTQWGVACPESATFPKPHRRFDEIDARAPRLDPDEVVVRREVTDWRPADGTERSFWRDLATGVPCPRNGDVLCTVTDPGHLHRAIHMDAAPEVTHELSLTHDTPDEDGPCFTNLWCGTCSCGGFSARRVWRNDVEAAFAAHKDAAG